MAFMFLLPFCVIPVKIHTFPLWTSSRVFTAVLIGLSIAGWFHFTQGWSIWLQIAGTVVIVVVFSFVSDFLAK
jgi:hypothetical protein